MTTVWLARHGEAHNPTNLLYGRLPRVRLTPEGQRQARALADFLEPRTLAAIYSSPMLRARRTADVILTKHPELQRLRIDSDLTEVMTHWQGHPIAELESIDWDFYSNPSHPEDESLQHIQMRIQRWLRRVVRRHAGSEVVGVSHGDPILILVGTLTGLPLEPRQLFPRPYIPPGILYRIELDDSGACRNVEMLVPHARSSAA